MVAGVRIRPGDGSLIQIDPSWECLALKNQGSLVCASYLTPGQGGKTVGRGTIVVGGCNEPILVVECAGTFVGVMSKSQSGAAFTWTLVTEAPGATVNYWVFDTTDVAQMAFVLTKGMRFRNPANGRVIFDSRYKYLRFLQMINLDAGTADTNVAIPVTSGYGVSICNSGFYTAIVGGPVGGGPFWQNNNTSYVAGVRTNGNGTVTIKLINTINNITDGPSNPPPTGLMGSRKFIGQIVDLRNY